MNLILNSIPKKMGLVIYLFINFELKMKPGKIAAQVSHAINKLHRNVKRQPTAVQTLFHDYLNGNSLQVCIAYKASLEDMENVLSDYPGEIVIDAGITQVAPNSKTVMALYPRVKSDEFSRFKLL